MTRAVDAVHAKRELHCATPGSAARDVRQRARLGNVETCIRAVLRDAVKHSNRGTDHATATIELAPAPNPPVVNDPALTERVTRSLKRALGDDAVMTSRMLTVGEDFAYIARAVPSVYWWVGITSAGADAAQAPDNHSERFFVDEAGMQVGLRSLLHVAVDFLQSESGSQGR